MGIQSDRKSQNRQPSLWNLPAMLKYGSTLVSINWILAMFPSQYYLLIMIRYYISLNNEYILQPLFFSQSNYIVELHRPITLLYSYNFEYACWILKNDITSMLPLIQPIRKKCLTFNEPITMCVEPCIQVQDYIIHQLFLDPSQYCPSILAGPAASGGYRTSGQDTGMDTELIGV